MEPGNLQQGRGRPRDFLTLTTHTQRQQCCLPCQPRTSERSTQWWPRPPAPVVPGWVHFPWDRGRKGRLPWFPQIRMSAPLLAGCRCGVRWDFWLGGRSRKGRRVFRDSKRWSARLLAGCPRGHPSLSFTLPRSKGRLCGWVPQRTFALLLAGCRCGVLWLSWLGVSSARSAGMTRPMKRWSEALRVCCPRGHRVFS